MDLLLNFETTINLFMQSLGDWLTLPFQGISLLATEYFFILIIPLIYWCIDARMGLRMAFMLVISGTINDFFKMLCHSPRPFWYDTRVKALSQETSFGLPSGHSQNSISLFGIMAATAKKKGATIFFAILIFLVGLSRIYLGMHFLRDVLSGWLIGIFLIVLYMTAEKPVGNWLAKKSLGVQILFSFLFSISLLILPAIAYATSINWQMPAEWIKTAALTGGAVPDPFKIEGDITLAGVAFGFTTGYACWLKKYGKPEVKGSALKRFARFFVGIIGVVIIYLGLKMVFPEEPLLLGYALRFVRYSLLSLWVSYFAPLLFKKMKLDR